MEYLMSNALTILIDFKNSFTFVAVIKQHYGSKTGTTQ